MRAVFIGRPSRRGDRGADVVDAREHRGRRPGVHRALARGRPRRSHGLELVHPVLEERRACCQRAIPGGEPSPYHLPRIGEDREGVRRRRRRQHLRGAHEVAARPLVGRGELRLDALDVRRRRALFRAAHQRGDLFGALRDLRDGDRLRGRRARIPRRASDQDVREQDHGTNGVHRLVTAAPVVT